MGSRIVWRLAVTAVALTLTTGCGGKASSEASGAPASTPTASPVPATTGSPASSTPAIDPNIPAAARAHTPAGAEAFVKHYLDSFNIAWSRPQQGLIASLSASGCRTCANWESTAEELTSKRQHYSANPFTVERVGATATSGSSQTVVAKGIQEARKVLSSDGRVVATKQRRDLEFKFALIWTRGAWTTQTVKLVQ